MPITHLRYAASSPVSHVADYRLTEHSLSNLPPTLARPGPGHEIRRIERAAREGKTWKDIYPDTKISVVDPHRIELRLGNEGTRIILTLEAWGDFNRDGTEDILLHLADYAIGGTYRSYEYVVLTRHARNARLTEVPFSSPALAQED